MSKWPFGEYIYLDIDHIYLIQDNNKKKHILHIFVGLLQLQSKTGMLPNMQRAIG